MTTRTICDGARFVAFAAFVTPVLPGAALPHHFLTQTRLAFEPAQSSTAAQPAFIARAGALQVKLLAGSICLRQGESQLRITFVGENRHPAMTAEDIQEGVSNYFIGSKRSEWRVGVPRYSRIRYTDVYRGIDLVFYGTDGRLEHDWIIHPHADPRAIRLLVEGAGKLSLDDHGATATMHDGVFRIHTPQMLQEREGRRESVSGRFVLKAGNVLAFDVARFRRDLPLIIDPILSYSTFLGGSSDDVVNNIAVDAAGSMYIAGSTSSPLFDSAPTNCPTAVCSAAFIVKLSSDGKTVLYQNLYPTFSEGWGVAVDSSGNAYLCGTAIAQGSPIQNFPLVNPIYDWSNGAGQRAFLIKLDASGRNILYSTFLTTGLQDEAFAVAADSQGAAYVTGYSHASGINFDAFVVSVSSSGGRLNYAKNITGVNNFQVKGYNITLDDSGNVLVTGATMSTSLTLDNLTVNRGTPLPICNYSAEDPCFDAFLAKLGSNGVPVFMTFHGGSSFETALGVAADTTGNAYVAGATGSADFQCDNRITTGSKIPAPFHKYVYVSKFDPMGQRLFSTCIGGTGDDNGLRIAIDARGDLWLSGGTSSTDFPTANAIQPRNAGAQDVYVVKLTPDGKQLLFSSYFGGPSDDVNRGIGINGTDVYIGGFTSSPILPVGVTPPLYAYTPGGNNGYDGYAAKLARADMSVAAGAFQAASASIVQSAGRLHARATARSNYSLAVDLLNSSFSDDGDNARMSIVAQGPTIINSCAPLAICTVSASGKTASIGGIPQLTSGERVRILLNAQLEDNALPGDNVSFLLHAQSDTNDPNESNNTLSTGFTVGAGGGCDPSASATPESFPAAGGSGTLTINSPCGWSWSASSPAAWVQLPPSGPGSGISTFTVLRNSGTTARSATVSISGQPLTISQSGTGSGTSDFDGNGTPDLVWQNQATGQVTVNYYTGPASNVYEGWAWLHPGLDAAGWSVAAIADIDGNGTPDLIWQNQATGQVTVNYYSGPPANAYQGWNWLHQGLDALGWRVVAAADFDGNGTPDLVWQNLSTGQVAVNYYGYGASGPVYQGWAWLHQGLDAGGWSVVAAADFDGNGVPDLVWQNAATGQVTVNYYVNASSFAPIYQAWAWLHAGLDGAGWRVAAAKDMNGDGIPDLVWQNNSTSQVTVNYYGGAMGAAYQGWAWLHPAADAIGWRVH